MPRPALAVATLFLAAGCATSRASAPTPAAGASMSAGSGGPEYLGATPTSTRAYTPAVRAGGLIFVAGQLGTDSTGRMAPGGVQAETRAALTSVRNILTRYGSSMDKVVKCTVFLADIAEWGAMNEAYVTFFPAGRRPARSAVSTGLLQGARVEIECIAAQ